MFSRDPEAGGPDVEPSSALAERERKWQETLSSFGQPTADELLGARLGATQGPPSRVRRIAEPTAPEGLERQVDKGGRVCLYCGRKLPLVARYVNQDFCNSSHAERYNRQTAERLMGRAKHDLESEAIQDRLASEEIVVPAHTVRMRRPSRPPDQAPGRREPARWPDWDVASIALWTPEFSSPALGQPPAAAVAFSAPRLHPPRGGAEPRALRQETIATDPVLELGVGRSWSAPAGEMHICAVPIEPWRAELPRRAAKTLTATAPPPEGMLSAPPAECRWGSRPPAPAGLYEAIRFGIARGTFMSDRLCVLAATPAGLLDRASLSWREAAPAEPRPLDVDGQAGTVGTSLRYTAPRSVEFPRVTQTMPPALGRAPGVERLRLPALRVRIAAA